MSRGRRFKIEVMAASPAEAFLVSRAPGKAQYRVVRDQPSDVATAIQGKLRRAETHPVLYADRIAEYQSLLLRMKRALADGQPSVDVVVNAMLDHGDSRVDSPQFCCVIPRSVAGSWVVFGYDFAASAPNAIA